MWVVVFTLGYFLGGATALVVLGLTVAARNGERDRAAGAPRREDAGAIQRKAR
jgi:hypothetical protein